MFVCILFCCCFSLYWKVYKNHWWKTCVLFTHQTYQINFVGIVLLFLSKKMALFHRFKSEQICFFFQLCTTRVWGACELKRAYCDHQFCCCYFCYLENILFFFVCVCVCLLSWCLCVVCEKQKADLSYFVEPRI